MASTQSGLNRGALNKAIDALHIHDIGLRAASLDVDQDRFLRLDQSKLQVQLKWHPVRSCIDEAENKESGEKKFFFAVEIGTAVRMIDKSPDTEIPKDAKPCVVIEASFVARYLMRNGSDIPHEALDEFATKNVIYHVWPYWREYLQSTCVRAQLPPFTLPMFVMRPKPEAKKPARKRAK